MRVWQIFVGLATLAMGPVIAQHSPGMGMVQIVLAAGYVALAITQKTDG